MVIGLLILIPIVAVITGHFTLKAYQLGLKYNYELKHDIEPSKEENPIKEIYETKVNAKNDNEQAELIDEWLNGERK